jgi:hypothetical protein
MTVFLEKINHYTTLEAQGLAHSRRPYRGRDLTLLPLWTFFKLYILKQGFRDGAEGFLFCLLSGVSTAVRAWKHRELTWHGHPAREAALGHRLGARATNLAGRAP